MTDVPDRHRPGDNSEKYDVPPLPQLDLGAAPAGPAPARPAAPPKPASQEEADGIALIDPEIYSQVVAKAREFALVAKQYLDLKVIETADMAAQVNDVITGAGKVAKVMDVLRMEAKKSRVDEARLIDKAMNAQINTVETAKLNLAEMRAAFLTKENARLTAEKAENTRLARIAADKAAKDLADARAANDIAAEVAAKAAVKDTQKELTQVARAPVRATVGSYSGAGRSSGLRRTIAITIERPGMALSHYKDNAALHEFLISLAAADARAAGVDAVEKGVFTLPGFKLTIKEG